MGNGITDGTAPNLTPSHLNANGDRIMTDLFGLPSPARLHCPRVATHTLDEGIPNFFMSQTPEWTHFHNNLPSFHSIYGSKLQKSETQDENTSTRPHFN